MLNSEIIAASLTQYIKRNYPGGTELSAFVEVNILDKNGEIERIVLDNKFYPAPKTMDELLERASLLAQEMSSNNYYLIKKSGKKSKKLAKKLKTLKVLPKLLYFDEVRPTYIPPDSGYFGVSW